MRDLLKEGVRDLAFRAFNAGATIPGTTETGYEISFPTPYEMVVRVVGDQTVGLGPQYFKIKVSRMP